LPCDFRGSRSQLDVQADDHVRDRVGRRNGESWRIRLSKGEPRRNEHRVAVVVSTDDLTELLPPLGFALAAALGGAQVSLYLGPKATMPRSG
jgi:hypothetical protein